MIGQDPPHGNDKYPSPRFDCVACHKEAQSYAHTAHHLTSSNAKGELLAPIFEEAGSPLTISEAPLSPLSFQMENNEGRFTETAITGWVAQGVIRFTEPIDILIGSNKRGQTYLYWSGNQLFELPVSYWKDGHRWINSPGYVDGTADFHRPVSPGCLECHATAATSLSSEASTNSYDRNSLKLGISCEVCHGASEQHIAVERAAAAGGAKAADSEILNPSHFSRDRQIDLCALCHSGLQRRPLAAAFSYRPGEPLSRYYISVVDADAEQLDVHGNQVGLLKRSACFRSSAEMTCSTCHNVHTVGAAASSYSARCLSCHRWETCGEAHRLGPSIQKKCVDCHMPVQRTNVIVATTAGQRIQATMRTHWIKVYRGSGSSSR